MPTLGAPVPPHRDQQCRWSPPERFVGQPADHAAPRGPFAAAPVTPPVILNDPARQHRPAWFKTLTRREETKLIQAAERSQVRRREGSVVHVEVFQMSCVRTLIIGRPRPSPPDRRARNSYTLICDEPLKPQIRAAVEEANKFYDETLTPELDIARDAGVLEVDVDEFELDDESEEHVAWFRERLRHAWEDPTGTVMLDPRSKRLLRQEPGQASSASPDRSKRAAVGAGFVSHLPTFPSAPMAHVLEARDELADGRADYRRCVRALSEKLVSSALDESLDTDIAEYWNDAPEGVKQVETRLVTRSV